MFRPEITPEVLNQCGGSCLPRLVGIEITRVSAEGLTGRMPVRPDLLAPNGYLHAASVIALADTLAGYGTIANLPDGAKSFTTIELKSNFLGTARDGVIVCVAITNRQRPSSEEPICPHPSSAANTSSAKCSIAPRRRSSKTVRFISATG